MPTKILPAAGSSRAPAAILHPSDPLPKTWRVVSEWSYRGQRGAWFAYCKQPGSYRHSASDLAQAVYRSTVRPTSRTSQVGSRLGRASDRLSCSVGWNLDYAEESRLGFAHSEHEDIEARAKYLGMDFGELRAHDSKAAAAFGAADPDPQPTAADARLDRVAGEVAPEWSETLDGLESLALESGADIETAMEAFDRAAAKVSPFAFLYRGWIRSELERRLRAHMSSRPPIPQVFLDAFAK